MTTPVSAIRHPERLKVADEAIDRSSSGHSAGLVDDGIAAHTRGRDRRLR